MAEVCLSCPAEIMKLPNCIEFAVRVFGGFAPLLSLRSSKAKESLMLRYFWELLKDPVALKLLASVHQLRDISAQLELEKLLKNKCDKMLVDQEVEDFNWIEEALSNDMDILTQVLCILKPVEWISIFDPTFKQEFIRYNIEKWIRDILSGEAIRLASEAANVDALARCLGTEYLVELIDEACRRKGLASGKALMADQPSHRLGTAHRGKEPVVDEPRPFPIKEISDESYMPGKEYRGKWHTADDPCTSSDDFSADGIIVLPDRFCMLGRGYGVQGPVVDEPLPSLFKELPDESYRPSTGYRGKWHAANNFLKQLLSLKKIKNLVTASVPPSSATLQRQTDNLLTGSIAILAADCQTVLSLKDGDTTLERGVTVACTLSFVMLLLILVSSAVSTLNYVKAKLVFWLAALLTGCSHVAFVAMKPGSKDTVWMLSLAVSVCIATIIYLTCTPQIRSGPKAPKVSILPY